MFYRKENEFVSTGEKALLVLSKVGIGSGISSPYRLLVLVLRSHSSCELLESVPKEAAIRCLFTSLSVIITIGQIVVGHG